ncbi:hypothetical protein BDZ91DRAFT_526255 [Kalaharituber pfeilii]|nr:hypothetical protein BDZ91DRAFT_526255 [Kalaharituber pfeilii]
MVMLSLSSAMFKKAIENIKKFAKEHPYIFAAIVIGIIGLAGAGVTAGVLAGVGFTAGGVAAGSLAAAWQAMISNVAAGSAFAILQSLSATGLGIAYGGLFSGGLGAIWSVWRAWKGWFGTDSEENQHEDL